MLLTSMRCRLAQSFAGRGLLALLLSSVVSIVSVQAAEERKAIDVPAGDASRTLKQLAQQAGQQVVYPAAEVRGTKTAAVKGNYTLKEALGVMLNGSDLVAAHDEGTATFAVSKAGPNGGGVAQVATTRPGNPKSATEERVVKLDTFEVMDSKLLNMDKPRSRDDAQPYVVFGRQVIEQSGASNLEDFLKNRLPMETTVNSESQFASEFGARSSINLRGLGTNQTLILVDGHRMAGAINYQNQVQPDLNGIPLAAIERIEILPLSASSIYGGSATGGVVNIILRRDYAGVEMKLTYANTFDTDSATRRVDLNAGFNLENGKTNVLLAASWSDGHSLLEQDRGFLVRNRTITLRNYPNYYLEGGGLPTSETTNIIANSGNLVLKPAYGGTNLGSPLTFVPLGYAGPASDQGAGLIANAGKVNLVPSRGIDRGSRYQALVNTPTVESYSATIRRQFSAALQVFADLGMSENTGHFAGGAYTPTSARLAASAAGNPFAQTVQLTFPRIVAAKEVLTRSSDRHGTIGLIAQLPAEWKGETNYSYSQSTISESRTDSSVGAVQNAAIASGSLNVFRDLNIYPLDLSPFNFPGLEHQSPSKSSLNDGVIRASGPIWTGPAGRTTAALLIEERKEVASPSLYRFVGGTPLLVPERSQAATSGYAEINVPLVAASSQVPLMRELELQLAGRRDSYTTHATNVLVSDPTAIKQFTNRFASTNGTVAVRWVPTPDVLLRTSYGTGFRPPSLPELAPGVPDVGSLVFFGLRDPKRGGTPVTGGPTGGTYGQGGNANLRPEHSETWSAGVVVTPRALPGLRLSIDWISLKKRDNILSYPDAQALIDNESLAQDRIIRGPNLAGDPAGWAGQITTVDASNINIAEADLEAFDLSLDYHLATASLGEFDFFAAATRTVSYKTQYFPSSPVVEHVGTSANLPASQIGIIGGLNSPLKFKGNFSLTWKYRRWNAGWTVRYFDSYHLDPTLFVTFLRGQGPDAKVASQTYHDAFVSYRFGGNDGKGTARWLRRVEVLAGVKNIFNKLPAFDVTQLYNGYGDARLANYYISVKNSF